MFQLRNPKNLTDLEWKTGGMWANTTNWVSTGQYVKTWGRT